MLLAAAAAVIKRHPHVHVVVVGERHSDKAESRVFESGLHQLAASQPLEDDERVRIVQMQPG